MAKRKNGPVGIHSAAHVAATDVQRAVDPKLARGFARQIGREMTAAARQVRAENFRFGINLAKLRRKIKPPAFNVGLLGRVQACNANPTTVCLSVGRAGLSGRRGELECVSVVQRNVERLRGHGADFESLEWGIAVDRVLLANGLPQASFVDAPVLFDQHFFARYIERSGDTKAIGIRKAIGSKWTLAMIYLDTARARGVSSGSIVLPVGDGVCVGQIAPVRSVELQRGVVFGLDKPERLLLGVVRSESDVMLAASIRTYLSEEQLSEDQCRALSVLRQWCIDHEKEVMEDIKITNGVPRDDDIWNERFGDVFDTIGRVFSPKPDAERDPYSVFELEDMIAKGKRKRFETLKEEHAYCGEIACVEASEIANFGGVWNHQAVPFSKSSSVRDQKPLEPVAYCPAPPRF